MDGMLTIFSAFPALRVIVDVVFENYAADVIIDVTIFRAAHRSHYGFLRSLDEAINDGGKIGDFELLFLMEK